MSPDPKRRSDDPSAAQQRFLSLFLRSEREVFRYVAALVPNVADAEDMNEEALKVNPPFRIGAAELGNWNAGGIPDNDHSLIRNCSGAMDEFWLFRRALDAGEIRALYSEGKPQPDPVAALKKELTTSTHCAIIKPNTP